MPAGRPKIEIDKEQFENLCYLQCTLSEIASWFKCSPDTIERWAKRTYSVNFAEAYKTYADGGKISLRRWQFRMAEKNVAMAIWLGKQMLGQRDTVVTVDTSNKEQIEALDAYFEKRRKESQQASG